MSTTHDTPTLSADGAFLLAYFTPATDDGEQVRLAVSRGPRPDAFDVLAGGRPVLVSEVGERAVRDPFLLRDTARDLFVLVATDLRAHTDGAWERSTRRGSRSIVVWESVDLVTWSPGRLVEVAPPEAGNTWAPKVFRSPADDTWLVFWASALYAPGDDRTAGSHQRILVAETDDFQTFSPARVYLDPGHDVIDVTFAVHDGVTYRFSANAQSADPDKTTGFHVFVERGTDVLDPAFVPVVVDVGRDELERGEGPAVAVSHDGTELFLLVDEFTGRGCTLFTATDPASGTFVHEPSARLPETARHGSLLAITADERDRLLGALR
ncbi:hypothetical protein Sked_14440 [Sanguibacter keddieii DSM 10542]|uniref:Beta-xylosidase n=1 Tax=Sanguibacter keddieii (strain ATCC 51767 / DSM 10542 / NCFB 3025 / ST-74) TaxID=446469 RepID=D1BF84_SANKS|nr:glycoside hydrolase family 43 protein [Sanguibacter keddieii]ACZ21380.1 hypothetical protein Sked_14440 [Sanguibacter keddieii DSM 10542]